MKRSFVCGALALAMGLCGIAQADGTAQQAPAGLALGMEALDQMSQSGSAIVSPESLYIAVQMAAQGAGGETLAQLEAALGVESPDMQGDSTRIATMQALGVKCANAYFTAADFQPESGYEDIVRQYYAAQGFQFGDDIVAQVNEWASAHTDGMIPQLLDKAPDENAKLLLANALLLDAKWDAPFDPNITYTGDFNGSNGVSDAEMMFMHDEAMLYAQKDGMQIAYLPYETQGLGMFIVLPEQDGMDSAIAQIKAQAQQGNMPECFTGLTQTNVELALPKVKVDAGGSMTEALRALGVTDALDIGADFSGISADEPLYIGDIIQKCALTVGEKGTRAAAATVVEMNCGSAAPDENAKPVEMTVDRPYLMFIVNSAEGDISDISQVLFAACIRDI